MGTISQMAEKCQKCPKRDKCDHKRMEMCAYIDEPKIAIPNAIPNGIDGVAINIGGAFTISREKLAKEIEQSLNKRLSIGCGW